MTLKTTIPTPDHSKDIPPPQTTSPYAVLSFDAEEFMAYVEEYDLSEKDAHALLETVWSIVVGFVDLAFGCHPSQQACGQFEKEFDRAATDSRDLLYSSYTENDTDETTEGDAP